MVDQYRRLAVFIDNPSEEKFLWVLLESTDDPAVWLDVETGDEPYATWIEAHEAGNAALLAYVDDDTVGPVRTGEPAEEDFEE